MEIMKDVKKKFVWSSEIFAYAVCPIKYRLRYVDKVDIPPTEEMVFGNLSHKVREALTKKENEILTCIKKGYDISEIENRYKKFADEICAYAMSECAKDLNRLEIEEEKALDLLEKDLALEFAVKAIRVFRTVQALEIEKRDLAEYLAPPWRYVEYKIMDGKLTMACIVDRIERHASSLYPVEIKTGKPPAEDVFWPQKIQLACHCMLVESHFSVPVSFGFVEYTQIAEKRPVLIDPTLRKKVEDIRDNILKGEIEEEKSDSCHSCEFREACR